MEDESVKIIWIILWILVGAGWSALSFQWLRKSVEEIQPLPEGQNHPLKGLILRRFVMFLLIALLLFLALRTEPIGAIAMVIVITIATWVQVIIYNKRLNKKTDRKEY
jgi:dipeptide/tripeptide permease